MTKIQISADLSLPSDVVTQAIAILARRGAGKTHTASVLVEEVVRAKMPVVVLDPTGAWWGLRSSADGERPGLPVVILGGEHGDVPLEPTAGRVIADVVVEHPGAYVIDLSGFESKGAEQRFSADFLERLYRAKAMRRDALLVVVDEADVFAPQRPGPEQTRTLGALESIVRRGRIRGMGIVLISQRAAVLNKNVLTQVEVLVAMQTTSPQDRAAIDSWIEGNGTRSERDQVLGSLAGLERGEAWVWSPSWLRTLKRVRVRRRETFDSSKTPEAGEVSAAPRSFAKVDLDALGVQIAATVEQAKANDPAALKARVRELEAELRKARAGAPDPEAIERAREEGRTAGDAAHRATVRFLRDCVTGVMTAADHVATTAAESRRRVAALLETLDGVEVTPPPARAPTRPAPPRQVSRPRSETVQNSPPADLGKCERAILAVLAQHPDGCNAGKLALLSGYRFSGGFRNSLSALRTAGLLEGGNGETMRLTADGDAAATAFASPLPTGRALIDYWLTHPSLGKCERAILRALIEAPAGMTGHELAAATDYELSGGFRNGLSALRTAGLLVGRNGDRMTACRELREAANG